MTQEKTRELALPNSFEEIRGFAQAFKDSGMFSDTKSLAQAIVKIQAGRELGLTPVYAMQNINLIRDRLTTSANTMAMLVKKSGRYNYRIKEHTDQVCSITFFEEGKEAGVSTFTMEDAKRANLVKPDSGWMKFPRAMLFSRAISQGARIYCPDAIGGIYTDEEIRSIPPVEQAHTKSELKSEAPLSSPSGESETLMATSTSETSQPVASKEQPPLIDLGWLKESQLKAHFPDKTAISWLRSKANYTGLDFTGSLPDIIARMTPEQARFLASEIEDRLRMAQ